MSEDNPEPVEDLKEDEIEEVAALSDSDNESGFDELWIDSQHRSDDQFRDKYDAVKRLGQPSAFGHTFLATAKEGGERAAVKLIKKTKIRQMNKTEEEEEAKSHLVEQINVMKSLDKHPNCVQLLDVFESKTRIYMVMECCAGGDLHQHLKDQDGQRYEEKNVVDIIKQVGRGIKFLHYNKIAHCGISPANLVYSDDPEFCEVKICDFGMAQFAKSRSSMVTRISGDIHYKSPEVLNNKYGVKCDIWSLGILAFFLLYGYYPFSGRDDKAIIRRIKKGFKPKQYFTKRSPGSPEARSFIEKCLQLNSVDRPTINELCAHAWLRDDLDTSNAPQLTGVLTSVNKLQSQTQLRTQVLGVMASTMTKEEINDLRQMFEAADVDNDGNLTAEELKGALQNTKSFSEDDLKAIISMADDDDDGMLSFNELLQGAVQQKLVADEERIWVAFRKFDADGDGMITVNEMAQVLGKDESECQAMFDEVDKDKSGSINYDEFIQMWAKNTGGYLWDQDSGAIDDDMKRHQEEVATRKATSGGITSSTSTETKEVEASEAKDGEAKDGEAKDGEAKDGDTGEAAKPAEALPSTEDLLASLQNNDDGDDNGGDDDWLAMALGEDDDGGKGDGGKKKKKDKASKKKDKGASKKKDKGASKKKDKGGKDKGGSKKKDKGGSKKKDKGGSKKKDKGGKKGGGSKKKDKGGKKGGGKKKKEKVLTEEEKLAALLA